MPVDEEGMSPCVCPEDAEHHFKFPVLGVDDPEDAVMYCPYCGKQADPRTFLPQQMARARAAMEQTGQQYMQAKVDEMLRKAFGARNTSRGSGITFEYRRSSPPLVRPLPTFEVEATRRALTCVNCETTFAVYSLATYCPRCGRLAPAQQLTGLVQLERDRIRMFDGLRQDQLLAAKEAGLVTTTYEQAIKNGFGALETYLVRAGRHRADQATVHDHLPATRCHQRAVQAACRHRP
jgi:hypothetical protein